MHESMSFQFDKLRLTGMLHAPALPGSPGFGGDVTAVSDHVLRDAETLVENGVISMMLENFGDVPFFPGRVPATTVAQLTVIGQKVKTRFPDIGVGINVLRNDGCSALSVAQAVGASSIRVNVLTGARVTDQGLIQGIAHELLRMRSALQADGIAILADVDVKHSAPLATRPITEEVADTIERGCADAVIVSGIATGSEVDLDQLKLVAEAASETPVLVGSGVTLNNAGTLLEFADGLIVGTSLKPDGRINAPIDADLVRRLVETVNTH